MNLILCGLQACGKTTIGKKLAETLGWDFADTDQWIEEAYGKNLSSRQIALTKGEPYFRALEREQIARRTELTRTVIAVGGGSLADPQNAKNLQRLGNLLYLKADPCVVWNRIAEKGIPSYVDPRDPEQSFYRIAASRLSEYEQIADLIVDTTGLNEEEVVGTILKRGILDGK